VYPFWGKAVTSARVRNHTKERSTHSTTLSVEGDTRNSIAGTRSKVVVDAAVAGTREALRVEGFGRIVSKIGIIQKMANDLPLLKVQVEPATHSVGPLEER
jgi:hypothetical protein